MSFKIQTQFLLVSLVFPVQLRMQAFSLWKQDMHSIAHQYLQNTPGDVCAIRSETRTLQANNKINEIFTTSFRKR